jgi:hypothetical protein
MPAVSPEQQRLFGQAYAVKKGDLDPKNLNSEYRDQIVKLADSMTLKQLEDYAKTKHTEMEENVNESEEIQFSTGYVMKNILSFNEFVSESQLNEGAKITPKELSREGEEFIKWFEKTMASGSVKSIVLEDNTAEVTFNQNLDISKDIFNMVREWPNAPAYMDLYIDVMSVNRGQLVMMIYGKSGMSFTL